MVYEQMFRTAVGRVKAEGRYRIFADLERIAGASLADIHGDPFDVRDLRATAAETAGKSNDAARPDAPPESAAASRSFANPFSR
jgi:hypothetical protein